MLWFVCSFLKTNKSKRDQLGANQTSTTKFHVWSRRPASICLRYVVPVPSIFSYALASNSMLQLLSSIREWSVEIKHEQVYIAYASVSVLIHKYCLCPCLTDGMASFLVDPFAEANAEDSGAGPGTKDYVHVRIQQRNGRKSLTTVQGLKKEFSYNKILKDLKKEFCCNGTVVQDPELGQVQRYTNFASSRCSLLVV